ncbi:MAG: VOC family protein [Verrucomicrobiales bacterium]
MTRRLRKGHPRCSSLPDKRLGQVSLTVRDAEESLAFYRDTLGMGLLSRQEVPAHGFTLYFLAFTDEQPPNPSIDAVENREWLWQRPYTTLELRANASNTQRVPHPPESQLYRFPRNQLRGTGSRKSTTSRSRWCLGEHHDRSI